MFGKIKDFLFPPSYPLATFELSPQLRSVLPNCSAEERAHLYPLRRAERPALDDDTISAIVRLTLAWGDQYVAYRQIEPSNDPTSQIPPSYIQEMHSLLDEWLVVWYVLEPEDYYELFELAHHWVRWRLRRISHLEYGPSNEVVLAAHWHFVSYLLLLELPE